MFVNFLDVLVEVLLAIQTTMVSSIIGIDIKELKKIIGQAVNKKNESTEINDSIDEVSKKLEESKEIIDNALLEINKQRKLYEQMKKEAEISQQISSMSEEQVEAINALLENTLSKQDKKSFPKNFMWNLFWCVLGAILGLVLGKFV